MSDAIIRDESGQPVILTAEQVEQAYQWADDFMRDHMRQPGHPDDRQETNMTNKAWTIESAIQRVAHGDPGGRTEDARLYLHDQIQQYVNGKKVLLASATAVMLLDAISEVRREADPERESVEAEQDRIEAAVADAEASPFLRRHGFWLDDNRLADLAERYPVEDDHSAFLAIETALLGDDGDQAHAAIQGGCEVAVELLANGGGELDGYRMLIHPSPDLDDPWIAGHVERVMDRDLLPEPDENGGVYDTAEIIRDAMAEANRLLKWSEQ